MGDRYTSTYHMRGYEAKSQNRYGIMSSIMNNGWAPLYRAMLKLSAYLKAKGVSSLSQNMNVVLEQLNSIENEKKVINGLDHIHSLGVLLHKIESLFQE